MTTTFPVSSAVFTASIVLALAPAAALLLLLPAATAQAPTWSVYELSALEQFASGSSALSAQ
jgi:hypothetical protein